jgi:hypothetical protein
MASKLLGILDWSKNVESDFHRNYDIDFLVETDDVNDGPNSIGSTVGLPTIASPWIFGNDNDIYAFCHPDQTVRKIDGEEKGNPTRHYIVSHKFSTRPIGEEGGGGGGGGGIDDILNVPYSISGSYVKYLEEQRKDRWGFPVLTSSLEPIGGPLTQIPKGHPTVNIVFNVGVSPVAILDSLINKVNDTAMWGLGTRTVLFSSVSWERQVSGFLYYYNLNLGFEIKPEGWDPSILDEGTRTLMNGGNADNPLHFEPAKNSRGERVDKVMLDGSGLALTDATNPVFITPEYIDEDNLFLLGIPATL